MVISNGCNGSSNTLHDPPGRIFIASKTKVVNLNVFNMIATINESKILMKHILYDVIVDLMVANVIYIKLRLR